MNYNLSEDDLTYKRPGTGVSPLFWDKVIGMKTIKSLKSDHVLQWDDLEKKIKKSLVSFKLGLGQVGFLEKCSIN